MQRRINEYGPKTQQPVHQSELATLIHLQSSAKRVNTMNANNHTKRNSAPDTPDSRSFFLDISALKSRVRRAILTTLGDGPRGVHDLWKTTGHSESAIRRGLRHLEQVGLVSRATETGRSRRYGLTSRIYIRVSEGFIFIQVDGDQKSESHRIELTLPCTLRK